MPGKLFLVVLSFTLLGQLPSILSTRLPLDFRLLVCADQRFPECKAELVSTSRALDTQRCSAVLAEWSLPALLQCWEPRRVLELEKMSRSAWPPHLIDLTGLRLREVECLTCCHTACRRQSQDSDAPLLTPNAWFFPRFHSCLQVCLWMPSQCVKMAGPCLRFAPACGLCHFKVARYLIFLAGRKTVS